MNEEMNMNEVVEDVVVENDTNMVEIENNGKDIKAMVVGGAIAAGVIGIAYGGRKAFKAVKAKIDEHKAKKSKTDEIDDDFMNAIYEDQIQAIHAAQKQENEVTTEEDSE